EIEDSKQHRHTVAIDPVIASHAGQMNVLVEGPSKFCWIGRFDPEGRDAWSTIRLAGAVVVMPAHHDMDIDQARTFLAIVTHGSVAAAGEQLHLTQRAVSARIRTLEAQLDTRLFVRDKSGARLTAAGERFVRHATMLVK